MKYIFVFVFSLISGGLVWADVSCECVKLACDACSFERGITFFTDKCGSSDSKVKSCARPTCIPIAEPTAACPHPPSADSGPRPPIVVKGVVTEEATAIDTSQNSVGKVKVIQGSVSIVRADGKKTVIGAGDGDVRESDRLESGRDGLALVTFKGGNKVHVHPDTSLVVKEYKDPKLEESRKAMLYLIKGKIRNQVEQKYDGKTSYYRVGTRGAVAGVRGTDFVIEHHEGAQLETKVEAFAGKVQLASLDEKQAAEIARGEGARFTADLPSSGDGDVSSFIKRGMLSPVYKIPEDRLKELDAATRVDLLSRAKKPVVKESAICTKPQGFFDQCLWHLVAGVCVRQRCNANGQWADDSRLEGDARTACPAKGEIVKDCDY